MTALSTTALAALTSGVLAGARWRLVRSYERRVEGRLPRRTAQGLIVGAGPIERRGGDEGVLILHGFGDTPQSVAVLAQHLATRGLTVKVPLLPGHGHSLRAFSRSRAVEWLACARAEFGALASGGRSVALIGQSMGGALATLLAAEHPAAASLVLLAPYFSMPSRVAWLVRWPRLVATVSPYVRDKTSVSIWDPAARAASLGFGVTPVMTLRELARITRAAWDAAPSVSVPTLMMHSTGDNRISVADAEQSFDRLGARDREFVRLEGCGHVIAADYCRAEVCERADAWLRRWTPRV